jgi:hypothetical protein
MSKSSTQAVPETEKDLMDKKLSKGVFFTKSAEPTPVRGFFDLIIAFLSFFS